MWVTELQELGRAPLRVCRYENRYKAAAGVQAGWGCGGALVRGLGRVHGEEGARHETDARHTKS